MSAELRQSPLDAVHRALGAKMVPFAGWTMPVEYGGLVAEHLAVRTAVGIFDVSHMGEILIQGRDALRFVQYVTCNDAARLVDGQVQYSGLLNERGGFVDDILVHRLAEDSYFLCVNAANTAKDAEWLRGHAAGFEVDIRDVSHEYAQLAVQGPRAVALVQSLTVEDITGLGYYRFRRDVVIAGITALVARTGYTGEDGVEIYCAPADAERLWKALTEAGNPVHLAALAPATRCGSKPEWPSTVTKLTTRPRRWKPIWDGYANSPRVTFSDAMPCCGNRQPD
jgi:aminomethyltransferase